MKANKEIERTQCVYPVVLKDIINSGIGTMNEKVGMAGDSKTFIEVEINQRCQQVNENMLYHFASR